MPRMAARTVVVLATFLALRMVGGAADKEGSCYVNNEPGGLTIKHRVTKVKCPTQFAFIVNILDPVVQTHSCTGVLIDRKTVAVPASCVQTRSHGIRKFPIVRVGSYNLNTHDEPGKDEEYTISTILIHESYDGNPQNGGDLALLELKEPLTNCTPISEDFMDISNCKRGSLIGVGWFGPNTHQGPPPNQLEVLPGMSFVDREKCTSLLDGMPQGAICACSDPAANIVWDHGSLLLCNGRHLVGLASYMPETNEYNPYVYTHMAEYKRWIKERDHRSSNVHFNSDDREL
ncbi:unnamed protein product [Ostreobium quekettii]|uniref:Peptidase S1 domain-containing protein n=1 Tax=Ostreobium quekettii TaxID=121088 RepID=A0A8S1IXP4_9CHLO|nr:unnamed protein product [Ostreobium quekettii]